MFMAEFYLLGGEVFLKRTMVEVDKRAVGDAGNEPVVLYFPWTGEIEDRKYRGIAMDYFEDIGGSKVIFAELTDSLQELKNKIDLSDLVYLPGGDTSILVKRLRSSGAGRLLKEYSGVILGNSAGSLAICKRYVVINGHDGSPLTRLIPRDWTGRLCSQCALQGF